ncbi:MAG: exosome complex protein Rrp42 [Candidatus Aenigmarchaeota archaeon]|nr:exosome complex protein Rrp42 [Candidatus Aenigmarchaeota archaeon]
MNIQNQYIRNLITKGDRIRGRALDQYRDIVIEKNPIKNAEGSALVKIGKTEVMVGVKLDIGEPFADTPDEGILIAGAEFSPIASPEFELGPPGENAIELARVVDRGIRESKCIDMKKLCIKKGEKVWMVNIDIQPLSHDGNLIDAAGIAAIVALMNARLPKLEDDKVVYGEKTDTTLPVNDIPIPVTVAKINGKLFVDPDLEEEDSIDARLTITTKSNGNVCALQKGRTGSFSFEEIEEAIKISVRKGKEIREIVKSLKT